ncbi:hypothetical protein KX00_1598 [Francisella sp. TX07-6608]|nr:hypothetical protein KX03_582 [Francisella tularensis subsp. novicida]KFJ67417.1 hypothetical protein DR83_1087 [Francisella tularensis subsp. novicida]OIN83441.1 hypothetical protein KX00_1598 [Francisella sp. TX07-6608]
MTAKKKLLIGTAILSSAAILGSCGKSETDTETHSRSMQYC